LKLKSSPERATSQHERNVDNPQDVAKKIERPRGKIGRIRRHVPCLLLFSYYLQLQVKMIHSCILLSSTTSIDPAQQAVTSAGNGQQQQQQQQQQHNQLSNSKSSTRAQEKSHHKHST
jgi:hypothetical protein